MNLDKIFNLLMIKTNSYLRFVIIIIKTSNKVYKLLTSDKPLLDLI